MVCGFGEGKVDIVLEKNSFKKGETIKGKVVLDLKKPKKAKELRIKLFAERETSRTDSKGRRVKKKEVVYSFPLQLGGEKEYSSGSYDFEITVPEIKEGEVPEGAAGEVLKAVSFLAGTPSAPRWYLEASLDIPMSVDITKKVQIGVA